MKRETLEKITGLIYNCTPEELEEISEALMDRRTKLRTAHRNRILSTIKVGDRVRLRNVKPLYLNGIAGTVSGMKGNKYRVDLDRPCDPRALKRFRGMPLCLPTMLELAD